MTPFHRSFIFSILFHVVVIGSATLVMPHLQSDIGPVEDIIVVELVTIAQVTNAPPPAPEPEPEEEPVPEPKPEPEPAPAPPPLPEPEPVSEPEPVPEPEPEIAALPPEPEPEPELEPEAEPEPVAEPEPEPAPEPSVMASVTPKRKPEPPKPVDPFASVLKTITDLKNQQTPTAEPDEEKEEEAEDLSFDEQIAQVLKIQSTKAADTTKPISISVHEAVAAQLRKCWIVPAGAKDAENLIISIRVDMNPDATVRHSLIVDMELAMTDTFFRAAAESALRATKNPRCQPLPLPLDQYDQWRTMTLNFNPQDML